jgi:hypothetical protein
LNGLRQTGWRKINMFARLMRHWNADVIRAALRGVRIEQNRRR